MKLQRFLAYDPINGYYERFDTIEEARKFLEEEFYGTMDGYHPDTEDCQIWELRETVKLEVIDSKEDYKNPEDEWPHNYDFDVICEHKFVDARKKFSFKGKITEIYRRKP